MTILLNRSFPQTSDYAKYGRVSTKENILPLSFFLIKCTYKVVHLVYIKLWIYVLRRKYKKLSRIAQYVIWPTSRRCDRVSRRYCLRKTESIVSKTLGAVNWPFCSKICWSYQIFMYVKTPINMWQRPVLTFFLK